MSRSIGAVVLIFLCLSWLSATPQSAITGTVTDSEGAVIAKARVLIHWDPSDGRSRSTQDVSVLTDDSGIYSAPVPMGFYDVFISAPAFTPVAAKVIVKEGQRVAFNVKLYVDPLVSKQIGGMSVEGVKP
jgi:Carboxypeptidase regulatory-like domain